MTDGVDGVICEVDDVPMLVQKLRLLLGDGSLRKKLQLQAIKSVDRFASGILPRGGRRCLTRWLGTKEGKRLLNFEFSLFI